MVASREWCFVRANLASVLDWYGELTCTRRNIDMRAYVDNVQILGWAGYVRVDGTAYCFLGDPLVPNVNVTAATQKSLTVS